MKKVSVLLILTLSTALSGMQITEIPPKQRLAYQEEKALVFAEKYGPLIGIGIGTILSMAMVGASGYGLHRAEQKGSNIIIIPMASLVLSPTPIVIGAAIGRNVTNLAVIPWLARKYQLPADVIKTSIKFKLSLVTDRELMLAAYSHDKVRAKELLQDKIMLYFGALWKKGLTEMLADFEQVMKIENSDQTSRQKLMQLRDLKYLEKYDSQQRQYFSLVLRMLLAVYDLYYKKPVTPYSNIKGIVYVDQHLYMTNEWLTAVQYMLNNFLGSDS